MNRVFTEPYIGADPGAKGSICFLHGRSLYFFDAPMARVLRGRSYKPITDIPRLWALAQMLADMGPAVAAIEKVWGVKGQGAAGGAALGHGRGCLETAFHAAGVNTILVPSQVWKADLGLYKLPKEAALALALRLWPHVSDSFRPVRGVRDKETCIGRADAALIAFHAAGGRP